MHALYLTYCDQYIHSLIVRILQYIVCVLSNVCNIKATINTWCGNESKVQVINSIDRRAHMVGGMVPVLCVVALI